MSIALELNSMASSKPVFQKMGRALERLTSDQDPESVHSFRTTSRRLQTLLEEILPEHDRNQKKLLKLLDRIRKRAGKVRDIDIQLSALRSLKVPQEPRRKTQLTQALIELRTKHERKLRKLLKDKPVTDVQKRLKRAAKDGKAETARDPLQVARAMLARVERPAGPMTEEVLHQYRIVVKRARYAAEFAPKSVEAGRFIAQLKRLQDAVGNWHDWLTLTQTAAKRIGEVNQSPLVAALHNVTRGKFRHAVSAISASRTIQSSTAPLQPARAKSAPKSAASASDSSRPTQAPRAATAA